MGSRMPALPPARLRLGGVPAVRRGSERLVGEGLVEVRTQLQEAEVRFHPYRKPVPTLYFNPENRL